MLGDVARVVGSHMVKNTPLREVDDLARPPQP
jgi:hypothetical protein